MVVEWSITIVLKTIGPIKVRGFESHPPLNCSQQRIDMRINWEVVISSMVGFFALVGLLLVIAMIAGEAKVNVKIDQNCDKTTDMVPAPITSTSEMTANEN